MDSKKILFITDIHQNLDAVKKINFNDFDQILCGGDILLTEKPDINTAIKIIELMPDSTIIVPGNCDNNSQLIRFMKEKLVFLHKKVINILNNLPLLGIGYCRSVISDFKNYRDYFLQDTSRVLEFYQNSQFKDILHYLGISVHNNSVKVKDEEEYLKNARDYDRGKFFHFTEDEIKNLFSGIDNLKNGIILTHSPAYLFLDKLESLPHSGSEEILKGVMKTRPSLVLSGHFHEISGRVVKDNIIYFNPGALKDYKAGIITVTNEVYQVESISV